MNKKIKLFNILMLILFFSGVLSSKENLPFLVLNEKNINQKGGCFDRNIQIRGSIKSEDRILKDNGFLSVYKPVGYDNKKNYPCLIVLPGWAGKCSEYENNTQIVKLANQYGFILVMVEMNTTIYESKYYPETASKWSSGEIPGGRWINEVILPFLKDKRYYKIDSSKIGILGISTGGRGAVLLCQKYNDFVACASLSGTFDLFTLDDNSGEYKIHFNVYGSREEFKERWEIDNSSNPELLKKLKYKKIFLVHGAKDNAVPVEQSRSFSKLCKQKGIKCDYKEDKDFGHGWGLWSKYLPQVFDFFKASF